MICLFCSIFLFASSSTDVIRDHELGSPEGRTRFLTENLQPYVNRADLLNQEIIALSQEVTQKMALLNEMLPTLNLALSVDGDFQQIEVILNSERLTEQQQTIADRIAAICKSIDSAG